MARGRTAFTLVEVLIVVIILAIIAMMVLPRLGKASDEARESALLTDLKTTCQQIRLYRTQHAGRLPHLNEAGQSDTHNFVARITGRTEVDGRVSATGPMGPYLREWPENPFSTPATAQQIKFGNGLPSPRDGTTGWYYDMQTGAVYPNSEEGAPDFVASP
jgi:general secretion pathway protein G